MIAFLLLALAAIVFAIDEFNHVIFSGHSNVALGLLLVAAGLAVEAYGGSHPWLKRRG